MRYTSCLHTLILCACAPSHVLLTYAHVACMCSLLCLIGSVSVHHRHEHAVPVQRGQRGVETPLRISQGSASYCRNSGMVFSGGDRRSSTGRLQAHRDHGWQQGLSQAVQGGFPAGRSACVCATSMLMVCVRCCKCAHVSGRGKFRRAALLVDTTDGNVRVGVS